MPGNSAHLSTASEIKGVVLGLLSEIDACRRFACGGHFNNFTNPGLSIRGHGAIGLPLSKHDADILKSKCSQSPFGKGTKTVVDPSVRSSWELNPTQFEVRNPAWEAQISQLVKSVHTALDLRCRVEDISAHLYKMLLYQEGAFFQPHKDSEKVPGMFGTLIVCLSSSHEGGDLVLQHSDEKFEFKTSVSSDFGTSYAAWYSDILHEVKPVTSGNRLVLTYNLVKNNDAPMLLLNSFASSNDRLSVALVHFDSCLSGNRASYPPYLIHRFEHQYTKASLKLETLKGQDYSQAVSVVDVCKELQFDVFLATMEREIIKDDEYSNEEISRSLKLTRIVDLKGAHVADSILSYDNVLLADDEDEDEPDDEEHSGWTGNEGMTATYWYRDTVMIVVPSSGREDFIYETNNAAKTLDHMHKLQQDVDEGRADLKSLIRLCEIVASDRSLNHNQLNLSMKTGKGKNDKRKELSHETVRVALEHGQFAIFDRALQRCSNRLEPEGYQQLGRAIGRHQHKSALANCIWRSIQKVLEPHKTLASRQNVAKHILTGLKCVTENVHEIVQVDKFLEASLLQIVEQQKEFWKPDGASLAELASSCHLDVIKQRLLPILHKATTAGRVAFINTWRRPGVMSRQDDDIYPNRKGVDDLCPGIVDKCWDQFTLDSYSTEGPSGSLAWQPMPSSEPNAAELYEEKSLTAADVLDFIETTLEVQPSTTIERILNRLETSVARASKEAFVSSLVPLLNLILQRLTNGRSIFAPISHSQMQSFFRTTLHMSLRIYIGPEPAKPPNWTKPTSSCMCKDCSQVNTFLQSPTQKVFKFPCGKSRRAHLHQTFNDNSWGFGNRGRSNPWKIETIREGNPNVWKITKNHGEYTSEHKSWKERFTVMKAKVEDLIAGENEKRLRDYLGDEEFEAVRSCRVERLPSVATGMRASLGEAETNIPRSGRQQGKRALGYKGIRETEKTSGANKRVKMAGGDGAAAEVIDLTSD